MPQPLAIWNSSRDVWEATGAEATTCLFCGHSDVYSETFTTSGTTRSGVAYALPTWEHRMAASASSSSHDAVELLMTPVVKEGEKATFQQGSAQKAKTGQVWLTNQIRDIHDWNLLPTPRTSDTNGPGRHGTGGPDLRTVASELMPTPRATRGGSGTETMYLLGAERSDDNRPQGEVLLAGATDWGPYAPAIHRWERVLGRPAPAPAELNSKGGHRLSPRFTEWMMGVPAGWICDTDISRNDQLKAAGNGVVPQQAAAALKDMLAAFGVETGEAAA